MPGPKRSGGCGRSPLRWLLPLMPAPDLYAGSGAKVSWRFTSWRWWNTEWECHGAANPLVLLAFATRTKPLRREPYEPSRLMVHTLARSPDFG
jgi:hypothetical protein